MSLQKPPPRPEIGRSNFQAQKRSGEESSRAFIYLASAWCPGAESNRRHEDFQSLKRRFRSGYMWV